MSKNNLPHIPLYIGDWEKDCNVLSLETEAAWLRIVLKMFTNGKQSTYKAPTKALQNLWRVSPEKVDEIIGELKDNNICNINKIDGFYEITCRRFLKENEISKIRAEAVSARYDKNKTPTKIIQTKYKKTTKGVQNADNDNDNDNDFDNEIVKEKGVVGEKTENPIFKSATDAWFDFYTNTHPGHGIPPTFDALSGKKLKSILEKLKTRHTTAGGEWTPDVAVSLLLALLESASDMKWLKDNFRLSNIDSQFDAIITNKIKINGSHTSLTSVLDAWDAD